MRFDPAHLSQIGLRLRETLLTPSVRCTGLGYMISIILYGSWHATYFLIPPIVNFMGSAIAAIAFASTGAALGIEELRRRRWVGAVSLLCCALLFFLGVVTLRQILTHDRPHGP